MNIKPVLALASAFSLSGCFFVYIPGGAVQSLRDSIHGTHGQNCVGPYAHIGERVRLTNGGTGMITTIDGRSRLCPDQNLPIRAVVQPD